MAITKIKISNITVFSQLKLDFISGINLFVGENGTGKTQLLKLLYAVVEHTDYDKVNDPFRFFRNDKSTTTIIRNALPDAKGNFTAYFGDDYTSTSIDFTNKAEYDDWFAEYGSVLAPPLKGVFIPAKEMLSHSQGFLALYNKYFMPFDRTLADIISNAQLPETREVSRENQALLDELSKIIGGTVVFENDTFYVKKQKGIKVSFSLEAEGLRKIGLLWKLIRNGLLEKGSVLFWDEPEANVNPNIIPVIVDVLLKLQEAGVQIFIATHNYILLKAFDLRKKAQNQVAFYSFYKVNDAVQVNRADDLQTLQPNPILETYESILNETINKELGE